MISMLLFYFIILLFLFYTYKNTKPVKWNEILNTLTLNSRVLDDTFRIPGPLRLPVYGTKWNLFFIKMNKLHEYYEALNRKYGDVVLEQSGETPIISLFKRQDIERVLKYPSKYPFRPPTEIVAYYRMSKPEIYSSVGIVNAQGEEWAHLRAKLTPKTLESRKILADFCPDLNRICDDFISQMKERRNENNVVLNVDDILKSMSVESACCLILGRRLGFLEGSAESRKLFQELTVTAKNSFKNVRDAYYGNGLWKYFPTKTYKNFVENEERMYKIVLEIVEKIRREDHDKASILMTILNTEGLDDRDKISGVIDFINAGIELMSHTMSFLLYYLSMNPESQEKIFEETKDMNEDLTQEDLSRAFYTRAAIHEAFRLSPSAFAIARILEEDFYLSGYLVKAGTIVLCQNMIASSKNENFDGAKEYKPERWLTENGEFNLNQCLGSSIVLPFGCGKRICPGKKYTELELIILVTKLVRTFKIKYHSEFDRQFEFVLAPKAPVNVQFCDR